METVVESLMRESAVSLADAVKDNINEMANSRCFIDTLFNNMLQFRFIKGISRYEEPI